jgi:hypothetical protein
MTFTAPQVTEPRQPPAFLSCWGYQVLGRYKAPYFDRHKLKGRGLRLIIGGMVVWSLILIEVTIISFAFTST